MKFLLEDYLKWKEQKEMEDEEMQEYLDFINEIDTLVHEDAGDRAL